MKKLYIFCFSMAVFSLASAQNGEFHLDKVYKISKKGIIDLSSSDAHVFITGSLRPDAHVKIDRKVTLKGIYTSEDDFRVDVKPENGNLYIREHENSFSGRFVTYQKEEYKIEIEVPEGVALVIRGDDGDYYVKNINGAVAMSLDDADAELADCNGKTFSFRLDDGDLRMNKGSGSIEIHSDDGHVEIYHGQFSSIHADMDDGDLMIETSLEDNGEYYFASEDGSIALNITGGGGDFDIRHDDGSISILGDFKTLHESDDHTQVTLLNGSASVTVRADDASVKLSQSGG